MEADWSTRHTLIQRVQNSQGEETWNEFVEVYERFIYFLLRKMNVDNSLIDDFRQEILLNLWNHIEVYAKEKGRFRAWLGQLIRNTIIDNLIKEERYNRRQESAAEALDIMRSISESDFEKVVDQEWREHLGNLAFERVSTMFPGNAIKVFKMSLENIPADQIASQLELSVDSVYTLKNRVKTKFKREIKILIKDFEF